jgi:hypothetical protein
MHRDVVISVQATLVSQDLADSYGIMCRANPDNNGDGYYFLIGGDGSYSIAKGVGGENGSVDSIQSDMSYEINPGQDTNIIQVVCAGDYLGLYVNGQYVISTHDTDYTQGYAGIAVAVQDGSMIDANFDNLTITDLTPDPTNS